MSDRPLLSARLLAARRRLGGAGDGDFVALFAELRRLRSAAGESLEGLEELEAEPSPPPPVATAAPLPAPAVADAIDGERAACAEHEATARAADADLEGAKRAELAADLAFKSSGADEDLDASIRATKRRERAEVLAAERHAPAAAARARLEALEQRGRRELLVLHAKRLAHWREEATAPSLERLAELRAELAREVATVEDRLVEADTLWQEAARLAAETGDVWRVERPSVAGALQFANVALATIAPNETDDAHSWLASSPRPDPSDEAAGEWERTKAQFDDLLARTPPGT